MIKTDFLQTGKMKLALKCMVLMSLLFAGLGVQAQMIRGRFNMNKPSVPHSALLEDGSHAMIDTVFSDLEVLIRLTAEERSDTAVQNYLKELAGALEGLARRLKKDRVITKLDVSKEKYSWVYIYDLLKE